MDNFRFDLTAQHEDALKAGMQLAFSQRKHAVGYSIHPEKGLVFFWAEPGNSSSQNDGLSTYVSFPFKMDAAGCADFARRWLAEADYGKQPDHDGDNCKGFRLYNEAWGHIGNSWRAIIAVLPAWAMHGK